MGTSTSSSGPGPGANLDPPWLDLPEEATPGRPTELPPDDDAVEGPERGGAGDDEGAEDGEHSSAPSRRYAGARRDLRAYINSEDTRILARGIGHYSKTGMGGAAKVTSRMRASTRAGAGLVSFLQRVRDGDTQLSLWVSDLLATSPSSSDVADAIVQALAPPGGSADEESLKDSMALALSELIAMQPNVELLNMRDVDMWTLLQLFLGHEICNRLEFDVGQFFESAKLDPVKGVRRELEVRNFVKNEVGVQLAALLEKSPNPNKAEMDTLVQDAVRLTFLVYEGAL